MVHAPCVHGCLLCRALEGGAGRSPDELLSLLSTLLSAHDSVAAMQQRVLRGTLALLARLAVQVATAWRAGGGGAADDLLAAHPSAPQEVRAALAAAPAAAAGEAPGRGESPLPPSTAAGKAADATGGTADLAAGAAPAAAPAAAGAAPAAPAAEGAAADAGLAALRAQQAELLQELADATDLLRFWSRRGEKAAAGGEGKPAPGREGDVPPMLAEVRTLLGSGQGAYKQARLLGVQWHACTAIAERWPACSPAPAGAAAALGCVPWL